MSAWVFHQTLIFPQSKDPVKLSGLPLGMFLSEQWIVTCSGCIPVSRLVPLGSTPVPPKTLIKTKHHLTEGELMNECKYWFVCFVCRYAASVKDGSQYFVLLIITDGVISDMAQTKESIVNVGYQHLTVHLFFTFTAEIWSTFTYNVVSLMHYN